MMRLICLLLLPFMLLAADVPTDAAKIQPIEVGSLLPEVVVRRANGTAIALRQAVQGGGVIIYYRGGWCSFCMKHLSEIKSVLPELQERGYEVVAISADSPDTIAAYPEPFAGISLLSDARMRAARKLGLAFRVDEERVAMYEEQYRIDIERDSGETHHLLPVPSVLVVNAKGRVVYRYSNPDYAVRLPATAILEAVQEHASEE